jgi:hypothetical protein
MPRFTFGRCSSCEFMVPVGRDGTVARHFRRYHTHAHQIVTELCDGTGWACTGSPLVVEAASSRTARSRAAPRFVCCGLHMMLTEANRL